MSVVIRVLEEHIEKLEKEILMADKIICDCGQTIKEQNNYIETLKSELAKVDPTFIHQQISVLKANLSEEIRNINELFEENIQLKKKLARYVSPNESKCIYD